MYTKTKIAIVLILLLSSAATSLSWFQEEDNIVTEAEAKAGWKLLFDGKTTNGWRTYQNIAADGWEIANGELISKTSGVTKRADLITIDQYDNFELTVDWKVAKGANGGIIYRA